MENNKEIQEKEDIFKKILRARIAISRLGEKDIFNWWDCEAQSEGGLYALKRLFKNTNKWAAMEISMRAAISKIEGLIESLNSKNKMIHLFNFRSDFDVEIWDFFYQAKQTENKVEEYSISFKNLNNSFQEIFNTLHVSKMNDYEERIVNSFIIDLGEIQKEQINNSRDNVKMIDSLIYGFSLGSNERLLVPTYRLIE
jgi:hypothetical protein